MGGASHVQTGKRNRIDRHSKHSTPLLRPFSSTTAPTHTPPAPAARRPGTAPSCTRPAPSHPSSSSASRPTRAVPRFRSSRRSRSMIEWPQQLGQLGHPGTSSTFPSRQETSTTLWLFEACCDDARTAHAQRPRGPARPLPAVKLLFSSWSQSKLTSTRACPVLVSAERTGMLVPRRQGLVTRPC